MKMVTWFIYALVMFACGETTLENPSIQQEEQQEDDYLAELKEELVKVWPKNRTINFIFHGHSVPSGYFRTPYVNTLDAYPHLFLKFIKQEYISSVVNSITTSIGGEQAEQGAKRFEDEVLNMRPDLIFIDYALNDRGIGLERSEAAWESMIKEALAAEVKIVLLTPTPDLSEDILDDNTPLQHHTNMILRLGKAYHIPVVDVYHAFKTLKKEGKDITAYMSQGNHPNELGHKIVLNEIVNELF
ncbi:SGNH/GDSL hydrolase family protein [Portibacter lacus]|uniref:SGNH hydrolase-type esterase domain-containing protein n=1 Tax=Portibacter lacus TaxID=1099794 RepID=A0AA37SQ35_9BACT|nr:SGNH/GDSL hydrolase family protein [Portibacter lacus]GLR17860.1 hypothetical protein GCM10007940_24750 [Portibacter lacus]